MENKELVKRLHEILGALHLHRAMHSETVSQEKELTEIMAEVSALIVEVKE